jgi:hypothetical protein
VVETALVVDVATKYSCNWTKDCIFKIWTLNCRLLAWQLSTIDWKILVFYQPDSLERLANAQTFFIFIDGIFSVAPHPFKQL